MQHDDIVEQRFEARDEMCADHYSGIWLPVSFDHADYRITSKRVDRRQWLIKEIQLAAPRQDKSQVHLFRHASTRPADLQVALQAEFIEYLNRQSGIEVIEQFLTQLDMV